MIVVMSMSHRDPACGRALPAHLVEASRAPLAARAAMSARIAPKRTITPPEWDMRSTMINTIGVMHAALRAAQKPPEDKINFRVETKRSRRPLKRDDQNEDDHPPQRRRIERGLST
jgi:hypothetical protein